MAALPAFFRKEGRTQFIIAAFVFVCVQAAMAQFSDEAFYTLRVLSNLTDGYGLRWNIDERVQVYDHPLWMAGLAFFHLLIPNPILLSAVVSAVCMTTGLVLMANTVSSRLQDKLFLLLVPFAVCASLKAYMFSGLEMPLTFMLLAWFIYTLLNAPAERRLSRIWLIFWLLLLTHPDNVLVVLPAFLVSAWQDRRHIRASRAFLLPLLLPLAWYGFCLFYYGFLFPPKYYERIAGLTPLLDHLRMGGDYFKQFVLYDVFGFLLIGSMLIYSGRICYNRLLKKERTDENISLPLENTLLWLMGGVILHLLQVLLIGGHYLPGLLMVNSLLVCVFVLYVAMRQRYGNYLIFMLLACVNIYILLIILDYAHLYTPEKLNTYYSWNTLWSMLAGQSNMELAYNLATSIDRTLLVMLGVCLYLYWRKRYPAAYLPVVVLNMAIISLIANTLLGNPPSKPQKPVSKPQRVFVSLDNSGLTAYAAGPSIAFITPMLPLDPLLVRINIENPDERQGIYFRRSIPQGYVSARLSGNISGYPTPLRLYDGRMRLLNGAPLLDGERLVTLLGFQLWWYDEYIEQYLSYALPQF